MEIPNYVYRFLKEPPAPTGLSFENLTATDVTLVWDHFTNLPSEFISYAIEYTDNNWQSIRNVRVFENQHSFSALDLQNGLYRFRVATVISLAPHLTQKGQFSTVSSKISIFKNTVDLVIFEC